MSMPIPVVQITSCTRTVDGYGNITAQSFAYRIVGPNVGAYGQSFSYVLQPSEFAADITPIIAREIAKSVMAWGLIASPPQVLNDAATYTVAADASGHVTVTNTVTAQSVQV